MKNISDDRRFLFVCTATRADGGKEACGEGGIKLLLILQNALDKGTEWENIVPVATGCLGHCELAPIVSDPVSNSIYCQIEKDDVGQVIKKIESEVKSRK